MKPKIIYREKLGAGDDTESNTENGILVVLSYWPAERNMYIESHYVLHLVVIRGHVIIKDDHHYINAIVSNDAKYIREAIKAFDVLERQYMYDGV